MHHANIKLTILTQLIETALNDLRIKDTENNEEKGEKLAYCKVLGWIERLKSN